MVLCSELTTRYRVRRSVKSSQLSSEVSAKVDSQTVPRLYRRAAAFIFLLRRCRARELTRRVRSPLIESVAEKRNRNGRKKLTKSTMAELQAARMCTLRESFRLAGAMASLERASDDLQQTFIAMERAVLGTGPRV
jgi:hypothetical protein